MTLGVSLLLVAAGAILIWGVTGEASGIDVDAIGVILIVVGIIGFILSLVFWDRWGAGMPGGGARRVRVVEGARRCSAPSPLLPGRRSSRRRSRSIPPARRPAARRLRKEVDPAALPFGACGF